MPPKIPIADLAPAYHGHRLPDTLTTKNGHKPSGISVLFSPGNSKQSFLAIPVMVQEKLYAVLIIGNLYTEQAFTNTNIETGTLFASYVAPIIRNDILLKDTSYRAQTDFLTGLYNYRHIIEAAILKLVALSVTTIH